MANISIRTNSAPTFLAADATYTLIYKITDPCNSYNVIERELVTLNHEQLDSLREAIDRISPVKSDSKEAFLTELKRIAIKYNVSGEINTQDHSKNYLNFGNDKASQLIFGYRINRIIFNKPEMTFI